MKLLLLALAVFSTGCASVPRSDSFVAASSEPVTVRWQRGSQAMVKKSVCERSASHAVRISFGKEVYQLDQEGRFMAPGWSGPVGAAPSALGAWATVLTVVQKSDRLPTGRQELHTPAARVAVEIEGGHLRTLSVLSSDNRETLSLLFHLEGSDQP